MLGSQGPRASPQNKAPGVSALRIRYPLLLAGEMAQRVKLLATKPNDLSFILGTHMVDGEQSPSGCLLTLQVLWRMQHTHEEILPAWST